MDVFTIEENPSIQQKIIEEAEKFYHSVQEARQTIEIEGETMNKNEVYRLVSHLEPSVEEEYKIDLDQFLSEKHKAMVDRVKVDGNDDMENLVQQYIIHRDAEKEAKNNKNLTQQLIKQMMLHRGAQEIDFGEKGKVVWGKTFNVRYKNKVKPKF